MAHHETIPPASTFQRGWNIVFWSGFGVSALLFITTTPGVLAEPETYFVGWGSLSLGVVASFLAAFLATRMTRLGASDLWFAKGTTAGRVIGVGWVLIGSGIVGGAILSEVLNLDTDLIVGPIVGVIGSLGAVALVAMIGPGYTEYREVKHVTLGSESGRDVATSAASRRRAQSNFSKQSEVSESR